MDREKRVREEEKGRRRVVRFEVVSSAFSSISQSSFDAVVHRNERRLSSRRDRERDERRGLVGEVPAVLVL